MKQKPAPLLNPATMEPMTAEELSAVFCEELVQQDLDNETREYPVPQEILDFYKMYRPSPLVRAYCLEKKLGTPAKIYYKFEVYGRKSYTMPMNTFISLARSKFIRMPRQA